MLAYCVRYTGAEDASMGPRSDNRGYGGIGYRPIVSGMVLQWVHGRITVVMHRASRFTVPLSRELQWVHGRITVVMHGIIGC